MWQVKGLTLSLETRCFPQYSKNAGYGGPWFDMSFCKLSRSRGTGCEQLVLQFTQIIQAGHWLLLCWAWGKVVNSEVRDINKTASFTKRLNADVKQPFCEGQWDSRKGLLAL